MNTQAAPFIRQLIATVLGTLLLVASVAFVSIPVSLSCTPGDRPACAVSTADRHMT